MSTLTRRQFIKLGVAGFAAVALGGARRLYAQTNPLSWIEPPSTPMPNVFRMGFGSCLKNSSNPVPLNNVVAKNPNVFVWLGDNIYADTSDPVVFRQKYTALGLNPGFQALWNQCPNYASWDDHDFGLDDAGAEFAGKDISKEAFLEFWKVPAEDPRRTRKGLYYSQLFGQDNRTVRLIQLDNRYFRSDKDAPNPTMLGAEQWAWLEEELKKPATFKIITSGITILPDVGWEGWHRFNSERVKLLDLIKRNNIEGVLFVSGDRHWNDLSAVTSGVNYPLYELCASSFDQSLPIQANRLRVGEASNEPSFGMVEIDWADAFLGPLITFKSYSALSGSEIRAHSVRLNDLRLPKKAAEPNPPVVKDEIVPSQPVPQDTVTVVPPTTPPSGSVPDSGGKPVPQDSLVTPTPTVGVTTGEYGSRPPRLPNPGKLKGFSLDGRRVRETLR